MSELRLGDILDDHCSRCHLITNHSIAVLAGDEVLRVRCRTCDFEHKYRHGRGGRKKTSKKAELFDQILARIQPGGVDD